MALTDGPLARSIPEMLAAAEVGAEAIPAEDLWSSWVWMLEGIGRHLSGEREQGRKALAESARRAAHRQVPIIQVTSLAQLALLDAEAGDWDRALMLVSEARAQIDRSGLGEQPTVVGVLAISGHVKSHELRSEEAAADLRLTLSLLERIDEFGPWYEAQARLAAGAAALALDGLQLAERLVGEARRIDPQVIGAPVLAAWLGKLAGQIEGLRATGVGELSPAELRVLRLLPTHLSFAKIAAELYVSPNAVKTRPNRCTASLECGHGPRQSRRRVGWACFRLRRPHPSDY
jgi:LuxR family transcriptional regulator, maltose regulon positive regulatory protein